jgi:hypothetical protein
MITKLISDKSMQVIGQYMNFHVGSAVCSIPYYNNRHLGLQVGLRSQVGKGSPEDILEEVIYVANLHKINLDAIDSITLKKFLVDNNIGIDCSGLAYHIMDAEEKGSLKRKIIFPNTKGFFRKIRARMLPEKNVDVATLVYNSKEIKMKEVVPGDIITMVGEDRNHVLVIHKVDYDESVPTTIYYTHAIAWPTDGEYGHGVRQGIIKMVNPEKSLTEQDWIENDKTNNENYTLTTAYRSKTEIRHLKL